MPILTLLFALNLAGPPVFEPNNGPLKATTLVLFEFFIEYVQTHDFQSPTDEDWIVFEPPPGRYVFSITQTTAPPSGSLTLNAQLYDADILTNPGAAPFAEYNPCPAPAGASVLDNDLEFVEPSTLVFLRVRDCFGNTGGDYEVELDPFEFGSPALPVQITGTVTESAGMTAVGGVFLVDSTNSATFSDGNGDFALVTLANTQVTIHAFSEDWTQVSEVVIPPQSESSTVSDVSVLVQPAQLDLSIGDARSSEDAAAASGLSFDITLSGGTLTDPFAVDYVTAAGSAGAADFGAVSGTLMFAGGNPATQTVTVFAVDDSEVELPESFSLNLSLPQPPPQVVVSEGIGTGTIDNDDTAVVSISGAAGANEGQSLVFDLTLDRNVPVGFDVPFRTVDGSALAGSDYSGVGAGVATFSGAASELVQVTIDSLEDSLVENDETFQVRLGTPGSALVTLGNADATGTISDNDSAIVSIAASALAQEGNVLNFDVTLDRAVPAAFDLPYSTADGSALAASDYTAVTAGSLNFNGTAGEVRTIQVATVEDEDIESDETLTVVLGTPSSSRVVVGAGQGTGTIVNDDAETVVTADLTLIKDDGNTVVGLGAPLSYSIVVQNLGPDDVTGALVTDLLPAGLGTAGWTCVAGPGADCAVAGTGDIQQLVDLAAGSQVTFTLDATLPAGVPAVITNMASVEEPAGVSDPLPENNTDTDRTATDLVSASGFEAAGPPALKRLGPVLRQWRYHENGQALIWLQARMLDGTLQWRHIRRNTDGSWLFLPWQWSAR